MLGYGLPMKWIALIAGALVIGYLLGGWSPRAANRRLEAKVDHLQRVRKNQAVQAKPSIQGITQMLNVPAQSNETAAATAPPRARVIRTGRRGHQRDRRRGRTRRRGTGPRTRDHGGAHRKGGRDLGDAR